MALIEYHKIYFSKDDLREQTRLNEKELIEHQADVEQKKLSLIDLKSNISVQEQEYTLKDAKIQSLQKEIDDANTLRKKANNLLDALGGEK